MKPQLKLVPKATRFAIFCRVSTKDQLSGYSLELQRKDAEAYVARLGGVVTKGCVYSGQESGLKAEEDRHVLQRLLAGAEQGLFDAVVIQDTTRLSRNLGVMVSVTDQLVRAGIALHDFSGPLNIGTPEGEFSTSIQAVVGRFTARQGVAKSIKSRQHIMRSGGISAGRPPFGRKWNKAEKRFEAIPEKVALLKRVYDLVVKRGKSMRFAAAQLDIRESSLRKAIFCSALTSVTQHLKGETVTVPCPALLTEQQQRQLVARLKQNATVRPACKNEYLLQGLVRCAGCGGTMTGQTQKKDGGKRYSIYRHPVPETGTKLPEGCVYCVPVGLLDDDVLHAAADIIKDGTALRDSIRAALAQQDTGQADLAERIAEVEKRITAAVKKLDQQTDLAAETEKGSEAREAILAKMKRTGTTLSELRAEHAELSSHIAVIKLPEGGADEIASQLRSLYFHRGAGAKAALSFAQRKHFVRTIVGRNSRDSEAGVFVKGVRPKGGSKKDLAWTYQLLGSIALADGALSNDPGLSFQPEIRELRVPSSEAVAQLAAVASASLGIRTKKRNSKSVAKNS